MPALTNIPMPPSTNHLYASIKTRGRIIRVKSQEYKSWEKEFFAWSVVYRAQIKAVKEWALEQTSRNCTIRLDRYFWFCRSDIVCKDGTPKKLDVTNRIKAIDDAIAKLIGIDDSWYWSGYISKNEKPFASGENKVDLEFRDNGSVP